MSETVTPTRDSVERGARIGAVLSANSSAIADDAGNAAVKYRVTGQGRDDVATAIQAGRHELRVDEPPTLAGDDLDASPVEYALAALVSCQVVTYRVWAAKLGIAVDDIDITSEADLDVRGFFGLEDGVRPGFSGVRLDVRLTGPESPQRYAELHAAVDEHCPVLDLFANPTSIRTQLIA